MFTGMDRLNQGPRIGHLVGEMKTILHLRLRLLLKPALQHQVRLSTRGNHINITHLVLVYLLLCFQSYLVFTLTQRKTAIFACCLGTITAIR